MIKDRNCKKTISNRAFNFVLYNLIVIYFNKVSKKLY